VHPGEDIVDLRMKHRKCLDKYVEQVGISKHFIIVIEALQIIVHMKNQPIIKRGLAVYKFCKSNPTLLCAFLAFRRTIKT
jgi:hypothetical protein